MASSWFGLLSSLDHKRRTCSRLHPMVEASGNHPQGYICYSEERMAIGTVKWFNATKGYGFIQPQDGGKDVFVHISAVERAGLSSLNEGQVVEYELVSNRGKQAAENLKMR